MRVVIIGGGIAAAYLANQIKKLSPHHDVLILSDEKHAPYDRIHLCSLIDKSKKIDDLTLPLEPTVKVELAQKITHIDPKKKKVFSSDSIFSYDRLIIATGSLAKIPPQMKGIKNSAVFRSAQDAFEIAKNLSEKEIILIGAGSIGLELLETLTHIKDIKSITLLVRKQSLYDHTLSPQAVHIIEQAYLACDKVNISYKDEIIDIKKENNEITSLKTKKLHFQNPFILYGIGIMPNIACAKESLECDRGILTDNFMQTSDPHIYAVGECAQIKESGFIAGHVKACTMQADSALTKILELKETKPFKEEVSIDTLKVGNYALVDIRSPDFTSPYEKVIIHDQKEQKIDEYYLQKRHLTRYIGINSNSDIGYIQNLIKTGDHVDINTLYENRISHQKGRLICSCEHLYYQDLVDLIIENGVQDFSQLKAFSHAGRVCGKCKQTVQTIIANSQHLIPQNHIKKTGQASKIKEASQRIEKFNKLHPYNQLDKKNFDSALKSVDIATKELNSWVSMITASMQLHPSFESIVQEAVMSLNHIPIIWLELSDCSGNSEAFIKSTNPSIEELIFDYISLDYHELLMSASADESETVLDDIIRTQKGNYILIVEGAVPLGMNGKFLRIGTEGETGIKLLQRCAQDAALVIAVGSCAFDGGVVAAAPNPTGAVGVSEALQREDIINIPGCPTNPINIVGTLLYYLMFEELPPLDKENRPLWAYEGRIHDNCERRGHYELGEFVKAWGDKGAKKGYCLFEMGCKGPYTFSNCPSMKFNDATSWPIQAGHGCMGCTEKNFFDTYAHERKVEVKK